MKPKASGRGIKFVIRKAFLLSISAVFLLPSCAVYSPDAKRPAQWGTPVKLDGVANLYRIDRNLYRSAQPTAQGMKNLEKLGIRTVINLRFFGDDGDETAATRLKRIDIPMLAWMPRSRSSRKFLEAASDPANGPCLVHCYHGSDRTGSMVALYQVYRGHSQPEEAIQEMLHGGYGFHKIWRHLLRWTRHRAEELHDIRPPSRS